MKSPRLPLNGWVVLDKPLGLSSTQALGKVRWLLNADKAGHGGTLDPLASGVLPIAFGEATMAVDTHLFRLGNRTGLAPGKTPLDVERKLLARIPDEFLIDAHHWLILHGRYVCKARTPLCWQCSVEPVCGYKLKTAPPV